MKAVFFSFFLLFPIFYSESYKGKQKLTGKKLQQLANLRNEVTVFLFEFSEVRQQHHVLISEES